MGLPNEVKSLVQELQSQSVGVDKRDKRYKGIQPLRYASDEVRGDLRLFSVNICQLAVDAVAERMRIKRLTVTYRGRDVSQTALELWARSNMDQLLNPLLVDTLALGASYLIVWVDRHGNPVVTPESAKSIAVSRDPITGEVTGAIKSWVVHDSAGVEQSSHIVHYGPDEIVKYAREGAGEWTAGEPVNNPLGVVPVVPLLNLKRIGDTRGYSVIDDLGHLVDALSKVLADMLVASEDVARPRRWATGVDLEEDYEDEEGFTADSPDDTPAIDGPMQDVVSPFEKGNRMFTVENEGAKFGQLPGADLKGYETAVNLLLQQIMSVSALPAHMMGVTSSNPASADAIRSAEASLTARAEARISVLGIFLEKALGLLMAVKLGARPEDIVTVIKWASASTKSMAQEADAITKLHSLGIITTDEAREMMGIDGL